MNNRESEKPAWWDERNNRAMLISRVSDEKQLDGVSLQAQDHHLAEYAKRNGLIIAGRASFQESAKSSKNRVHFQSALEQGEACNAKHVIFDMWDRVTRNFTDLEMLEERVNDGKLILHIASSNHVLYEGGDESAFFNSDFHIVQAKQENRTRRRKTIDGMKQRCRNGWYPSRPPFGYHQEPVLDAHGRPKKRGSTVVGPAPDARRLLRRERELHLAGFSLDRIRDICLAEKIVPMALIPHYHRSTIDKHLKCVFYAALKCPHGDRRSRFVWRGEEYAAKHEPVFTADEWTELEASFGKKATQKKLKHGGLFAQGPLTLACADSECGCKITYAPKMKPSGLEFRYYRCADGKHVHRGRGEKQVNVPEEKILADLGGAVDAIAMTEDIAHAIAHALNDTHRQVKAQKVEAVKMYKAQLEALDEKENRIVDLFAGASIDADVFKRQQVRVREERDDLFDKLQAAENHADDAYLVTAERVLELAKNAKALWNTRSPEERRDFLAKLLWNPRLNGRSAEYDLRKPFDTVARMSGAEGWRPQGDGRAMLRSATLKKRWRPQGDDAR